MNLNCPKCKSANPQGAKCCQACGAFMGKKESFFEEFFSPHYPKTPFLIRDEAHRAQFIRNGFVSMLMVFALGFGTAWLLLPRGTAQALPAQQATAATPTTQADTPTAGQTVAPAAVGHTATPLPTSTARAVEASRPTDTPAPTVTPQPTSTPEPPPTPAATATPLPTTAPGSLLLPGQTWYEGGLALTMNVSSITGERLTIDLVLDNLGGGQVPLVAPIDPAMVRLVANTGAVVTIVPPVRRSVRTGSGFTNAQSMALPEGERFVLAQGGFFDFNIADPNITSLTVEVVNLSRIVKAAWRVDIPR